MYLNSGSFFCYFTRMNALLFCDLKTKWNKREKEMCLGWPESKWSCGWLPCFSTVLVNSSGNEARERQTKYWKMAARLSDKVSSADVNSLFTLIVFPKKKNKGSPWYFVFLCLLLKLIRKIWANYPEEAAEEEGTRQLLSENVNEWSLGSDTKRTSCPFVNVSISRVVFKGWMKP